jgi:hypothetical protein
MRVLLVVLLFMALLAGCGAEAGSLTLADPHHGHEIGVACDADLDLDECRAAAAALLATVPADAAKVESIRVEPLESPPAGAAVALVVTLDHEMFLQSGEQAYTVVLPEGSDRFEIEMIRD